MEDGQGGGGSNARRWKGGLNFIGRGGWHWLTPRVFSGKSNTALTTSLLAAVILWGASNAGVEFIIAGTRTHTATWPPIWTGGTRFLCAGLLLLGVLRWTDWLGPYRTPSPDLNRQLWWRGGLSLAVYIVIFNWSLRFTSVAHITLYLGATPVWALLWEGWPGWNRRTAQRYGAALITLGGVAVLLWPALKTAEVRLRGEVLGLAASVLWTHFGRQCRALGASLSGAEVTAHAMWRAGLCLLPLALVFEVRHARPPLDAQLLLVQAYCIVVGGVLTFVLWTNALRHWPASQVLLFNNLIPLCTMLWAHYCLGEPVTATFWVAMILIAGGVLLGQASVEKAHRPEALAQTEV